jgi:hypothetical protein
MESNVGANNPLAGQSGTCLNGAGARYRAIGTSEEVKSVQNSVKNLGLDGIGFTFFSYGNVGSIANNTSYGYITLDNIDPIFASYGPQSSTGAGYDPGQPDTAGTLPAAANLTNCSGAFPCPENQIWAGGLSFPNLRNGTYRAWSVVRLVSNGTGLTNAKSSCEVLTGIRGQGCSGLCAGHQDDGDSLFGYIHRSWPRRWFVRTTSSMTEPAPCSALLLLTAAQRKRAATWAGSS